MKLEPPSPTSIESTPKSRTFLTAFMWVFVLLAIATSVAWVALWSRGLGQADKARKPPAAESVPSR